VVKYRFSPEVNARLLAEKWRERHIEDPAEHIGEFQVPFEDTGDAGQQASGEVWPLPGPHGEICAKG